MIRATAKTALRCRGRAHQLRLAPSHPTVLYHVAEARAATGRVEQAIVALERAEGRDFPERDAARELLRSLAPVD